MGNRKIWLIGVILSFAVVCFLVIVIEKEVSFIEVAPDESIISPILTEELPEVPGIWRFDSGHAFFVEYRLERDRVRGQELELLNDLTGNPEVSIETRAEAEKQILKLIEIMEKELIIENMLKAQGYPDAIFFGGSNGATIMVHTGHLGEEEFWRISDMVAAITGFSRENVQVIQQRE